MIFRKKRPPEKHVAYFALVEACRAQDCPICWLVKQCLANYFDKLLFEGICNEEFINQFRAAHGFCNEHAYQFAAYNDGLAIALTHRDLLMVTLAGIQTRGLRFLTQKASQTCLVCELANREEIRNIAVILDFLSDPEFKTIWLESEGLCVPHYRVLIEHGKNLPVWLREFQIARYKELVGQLDRYLESCNFAPDVQQPILTKVEALIWQKAVRMLFGYEGKR